MAVMKHDFEEADSYIVYFVSFSVQVSMWALTKPRTFI